MTRLLALAILSCVALSACQQDTPEQPTAAQKAQQARKAMPALQDNPTLREGLSPEQLRKMDESIARFADVEVGKPVEILAQTEHKIAGTDLSIEFKQIKRDSRCPADAQCAWEGEVIVEIVAKDKGKPQAISLGKQPVDWKGYRLTMQDVLPHPVAANPAPGMPRLLLLVGKAEGKAQAQVIPGTAPTAPPSTASVAAAEASVPEAAAPTAQR